MTRLLLAVNVVLDLVLDRRPYAPAAAALWALAEAREVEAVIPAHGVTTVFYLAARERGARFAHRVVNDLILVPGIAAVDGPVLRRALALGWADFEDAVCAACAEDTGCDWIVTRDPRGFRDAPVSAVDPATALALLTESGGPGGVAEKPAAGYRPRTVRRAQRHRARRFAG